MIIYSSDQVSRFHWLRRFPIPRNLTSRQKRASSQDAHGPVPPAQRERRHSISIATFPIPAAILASTAFTSTSTIAGPMVGVIATLRIMLGG
jgi:hypothetical protein